MKAHQLIIPAVAITLLASNHSHAAIVASGLRDIVISNTFEGIYLDVDTGTYGTTETGGWDLNPFFSGEAVANSQDFQPVRATVAVDAAIVNLDLGLTVDGSSVFASGFGGSETHIGTDPGQFESGSEGYLGFQFIPNGEAVPLFGWMRVVLSDTGTPGLIREWAYEDSGAGINVGAGGVAAAVPEPSAVTLGLVCAAGFALRRRRN